MEENSMSIEDAANETEVLGFEEHIPTKLMNIAIEIIQLRDMRVYDEEEYKKVKDEKCNQLYNNILTIKTDVNKINKIWNAIENTAQYELSVSNTLLQNIFKQYPDYK